MADYPDQEGEASGWDGWAKQPGNMAALVQFGLQLSQPMAVGQNWMGQVGQAIGSAGEAQDRVTKQQLAESENMRRWAETDSRSELRGAQADMAGMRADNAALRANLAQEKLDVATRAKNEDQYNQMIKQYAEHVKNKEMFGQKPLSREEWFKAMGLGHLLNIPARPGAAAPTAAPPAASKRAVEVLRMAVENPEEFTRRYGRPAEGMATQFDMEFGAGAAKRALGR